MKKIILAALVLVAMIFCGSFAEAHGGRGRIIGGRKAAPAPRSRTIRGRRVTPFEKRYNSRRRHIPYYVRRRGYTPRSGITYRRRSTIIRITPKVIKKGGPIEVRRNRIMKKRGKLYFIFSNGDIIECKKYGDRLYYYYWIGTRVNIYRRK